MQKNRSIVLHCNTEYPTPFEDVNLRAMLTIKEELGVKVGYSDHTKGIEVPIAAVALGAEVIEKHFTLDRNLPGPDHKASLAPNDLKAMVDSIRNIEKALGDGEKKVTASERQEYRYSSKEHSRCLSRFEKERYFRKRILRLNGRGQASTLCGGRRLLVRSLSVIIMKMS